MHSDGPSARRIIYLLSNGYASAGSFFEGVKTWGFEGFKIWGPGDGRPVAELKEVVDQLVEVSASFSHNSHACSHHNASI